ncbi:hypothetical protein LTR85_001319 [Meristemomyces frigidus]|nr:hypothetical protein LTR85_001319 [Meristemomyces frigidus]
MIPCSDLACSSLAAFGSNVAERCSFSEDSDIVSRQAQGQFVNPANHSVKAGIGVLLSFIIYGAVTYLISAYIFFFVEDGFAAELTNTLDGRVVETTRILMKQCGKLVGTLWKTSHLGQAESNDVHWMTSLKQVLADPKTTSQILVMLSDQQLVLGFSILTVGYVKFVTMTEYHFAIVSALSNISFVVHVSTIPVVVRAMFDNEEADSSWYSFKKLWRAIAKLIFDILLFISFFPTGNRWWLVDYGLPTYCVWYNTKGNYNGRPMRTMIADMVLLSWGVAYELHAFFLIFAEESGASKLLECVVWVFLVPRQLHARIRAKTKQQTSPLLRWVFLLLEKLLWVFSFVVFVSCEVIASQTLRLTRSWAMLISNSVRIFRLRARAPLEGRIGNENAWSFGQTVSIFMLLLPTFLAFELCYDKYMEDRQKASSSSKHSTLDGSRERQGSPDLPLGHRKPSRTDTEQRIGEAPPPVPLPKAKLRNARIAVSIPSARPGSASAIDKLVQAGGLFTLESQAAKPTLRDNCYYFGYPISKLQRCRLEKSLYEGSWFGPSMVCLMFVIYVTVTGWAIKGWAF